MPVYSIQCLIFCRVCKKGDKKCKGKFEQRRRRRGWTSHKNQRKFKKDKLLKRVSKHKKNSHSKDSGRKLFLIEFFIQPYFLYLVYYACFNHIYNIRLIYLYNYMLCKLIINDKIKNTHSRRKL